ncbi:MAG TPA: ATP-binding protein [Solirubrobacteraceae bacterium]|nr:ATP-binding protein [Solirubrobacteraceae bacterium]
MRPSLRPLAPSALLKLPTRTARMRLTLLYAGLFLVLGTALLAVIYVLVARGGSIQVSQAVPAPSQIIKRLRVGPGGTGFSPPFPLQTVVSQQRNQDLDRLLTISWVVLAITTAGAAVIGWFAAGRVLRPLRDITSTAQTISAGNLHERLALKGPNDEFKRLGDTLDDLLARLEGSFESQRRFVANASHELRTPLTLERTLLQVALSDPNANEETLRATCEELLVSQAEQERLLEGLLTLTSSERGLDRREPIDLAAQAESAIRQLDSKIERHDLALGASLDPATTTGDAALIRRLIANLIDNAVDHNIDGGRVEIRTEGADGYALVGVTNTGPQVPADQVERLFEPFQRLDGTRAADDGHHGLGLSIVRAIAVAHNAELAATPRAGGGLSVTVRFPGGSSA